ncbi:MAG: NAD(P)H-dependent oxidoreductase [Bacteroidota bacterium]
MKKVLAFGASNSRTSINKTLAVYAAKLIDGVEVFVADLNDYNLPLYSPDLQQEQGFPEDLILFDTMLDSVDGIVMSMAEYNGNYTTAFKNLFDWLSRIDMKTVWKNKPILLLGTSPGSRGAIGVLSITKEGLPFFGGRLIADFSLPLFYQNFQHGKIVNEEKQMELTGKLRLFKSAL